MVDMDSAQLTRWLKNLALQQGFASVGIAPAVSPPGAVRLGEWIEAGYAGEMRYFADRRDAYDHPSSVLDGVRSVVMLTFDYRTSDPCPAKAGFGRVSRYAWGTADYHDVIHHRLKRLAEELREQVPDARVRGVVDTAPLLERDFAEMAGLGWIGKHTLLLNRGQGSWFFLAALLTDRVLTYDAEPATDHCGSCTACLDVCPTNAFPQPHVLDASRCISYLTIEHRGPIPRELRAGMGEWVFGCDLCQDVCPWNHRAPASLQPEFLPTAENNPLDLAGLFELSEGEFRARFRHKPLWRPKRRGLLRNAAIALGNRPSGRSLPALIKGLNDEEALVRGAAAWALGNHAEPEARVALLQRRAIEPDPDVGAEIDAALA